MLTGMRSPAPPGGGGAGGSWVSSAMFSRRTRRPRPRQSHGRALRRAPRAARSPAGGFDRRSNPRYAGQSMTFYAESLRAFLRPILSYLDDDSVSEILVNGPDEV